MDTNSYKEINEVMEAVLYKPAVSIIVPFEPNMNLKSTLQHSLKSAVDRVEKELRQEYPGEMVELMMKKISNIIKGINFNSYKKSIAIYASPVFEKVLYLDVPVEEKITIDESFEIRDLVYSKKELHKYLVLVLGGKHSRIFLGNTNTFVRIVSDTPESIHAFVNDAPERVANFSDATERKHILQEKFIRRIDESLGSILSAYQLPLFVMAPKRTIGHFRELTKHASSIVDYVHGNFEEATIPELRKALSPHIADWQKVRQKVLLLKLENAASHHKLASGINNVWKEASNHQGNLLMVEKGFMYPAEHTDKKDQIRQLEKKYNKYSYIKDAVDDVIEKVLEAGGDVEFVDEGLLAEYQRIALIKYY